MRILAENRGGAGRYTMYRTCRHVKTNGIRCKSPALRGGHFCYYHSKIHTIGAEPNAKFGPLQLPTPEDRAAIQISVARISDAIINDRLNQKKASSLLYGLQIASQFIDRKEFFYAPEAVQSAELAPDGDELAPDEFVCDDEEYCEDCPYTEICPRCAIPKDDKQDDNEDDDNDQEDNDGDEDE
jgi:hypothetical protein